MNRIVKMLIVWVGLVGVSLGVFAKEERAAIVPEPLKVEYREGSFEIGGTVRLVVDAASRPAAQLFADQLAGQAIAVRVEVGKPTAAAGCFSLSVAPDPSLGEEGYELEVRPDRVVVRGGGAAGVFYALQTVRQLLPPEFESGPAARGTKWRLPCVQITDRPRFPWRGLMLDPARYFLETNIVLKTIDAMASYKMNRLHLHLTDDLNWRIEIKHYPKFTDTKNWPEFAKDPARGTGFYTQDEMRKIIQYAAARHIVVIPEFEIPAHARLACHLYPELLCTTNSDGREMCACSDQAFAIMTNVIDELIDLFPSPWIHVGGDESDGTSWQCQPTIEALNLAKEDSPELTKLFEKSAGKKRYLLYRYLMRRVCQHVVERGRTPVLWDDLAWQGRMPTGAMIMQWHYQGGQDFFVNTKVESNPSVDAARHGTDAVVCPFSHLYFDLPGTCQKVYEFEPMPEELTAEQQKHILGPQANNWDCPPGKLDFRLFPKLLALAEIAWSPPEKRDFNDFSRRLAGQYARLAFWGINYAPDPRNDGSHKIGTWTPATILSTNITLEFDATDYIKQTGDYFITPCYEKGNHAVKIAWVALLQDGGEINRDTHAGSSGISNQENTYKVSLSQLKRGAKFSIQVSLSGMGGTDTAGSIFIKKVFQKQGGAS